MYTKEYTSLNKRSFECEIGEFYTLEIYRPEITRERKQYPYIQHEASP